MEHRRVPAFAAEDIPTGSYVRLDGDQAFSDPSLTRPGGVAGQPCDAARIEVIAAGSPISVLTDGGVQTRLLADVEMPIRGVVRKLLASDNHYLHLSGGRVVGFLGDGRGGL